mmetsp:Transcript_26406/g.42809  ORF Transcript_26406/g.42809 Transcript_26406/m.42809 type:complete len:513 (+) Transcript_26406:204-1742(+)|eukprot:CAMPEP_0203762688 /NCGR_PEP_ID=MMETSP0098-20131031/15512_1 /ASSEMBLY_ACC=CAM_ASM_000208 /TAXON_ID=96639 /ORGANISM=" , Strain NY0313808BC1" /LENGTH=512 /DNA_ID=CAMNT_0050657189 /DNA_START=59 /DNA_END=1597 /DNA_ORIENTATION=-
MILGIDAGTQSLKTSVYDSDLTLVFERNVNFDTELGKYGTTNGQLFMPHDVARSPVCMWFEALGIALNDLKANVDMSKVIAICGSAQQHSSVWWKDVPTQLNPDNSLVDCLKPYFAMENVPIWSDSSTHAECVEVEERIGGAVEMAKRTGSVSLERFTGNQIARIYKRDRQTYEDTKYIQLLSAAIPTVLMGELSPTDTSDGAGMNMMDIRSGEWMNDLNEIYNIPRLNEKLGKLCLSTTVVGTVCEYFQLRFGFSKDCRVVAFTGDNPSALVGSVKDRSDVVISLGTSDTALVQLEREKAIAYTKTMTAPGTAVSLFPHPTDEKYMMVMTCFKNGGAVRENEKTAQKSWEDFDKTLLKATNDNEVICFFQPHSELAPTPSPQCMLAFSVKTGESVAIDTLSWEQRVRGVVLCRVLSIKSYLEQLGATVKRVVLTGGGSKSSGIPAVLSSVLNVDVVTLTHPDSTTRGAVIKAMISLGLSVPDQPFVNSDLPKVEIPVDTAVYRKMAAKLHE